MKRTLVVIALLGALAFCLFSCAVQRSGCASTKNLIGYK